MARPSWPLVSLIADFTAGPPNVPGLSAVSLLNQKTALRQLGIQRGRQYELGSVQAGTMSMDLTDTSEYLNPVNASSPWNSGGNSLLPYRCVQAGAWWNTSTKDLTGNLLNSTNFGAGGNNAFDPSFETSAAAWGNFGTAASLALSTTQAFAGTHSLACTMTALTDIAGFGVSVAPGQTYTLSIYVYVAASHTVTASFVNFPGALGSTIASATSSTTAAWQRLTMTGVPTSVTTALQVKVATGSFSTIVYLDAVQLELGAVASAFIVTGPTFFPQFTGYIERYPQHWDSAGFRGIKPLQAVDALAPLSGTIISQSYAATIAIDGPAVYIPYSDDSFPQAVQRSTGGQPMIGYQELGTQSATANFGGDTFLDGSKAVTLVQQNTAPVTFSNNTQLTYLGTRQGDLSISPQSFSLEIWVRYASGVIALGAAAMGDGESTLTEAAGPQHFVGWIMSGGSIKGWYSDPNGLSPFIAYSFSSGPWNGYPDGLWHQIVISLIPTNQIQLAVDGAVIRTVSPGAATSVAVSLNNFFVLATTYFGDAISQGSVANLAAYGSILSSGQLSSHYQRGIGYLGEFSGTRAARLLTQYWSSNIVTDTGKTQMANDFSYDSRSVLDVLQEIADTEGGLCWVDAAGVVHQDSREARYVSQPTAQFVFGENTGAGELPYTAIEYDYDPTYVFSEADLTAASGTVYKSINATSQTAYGQRILSKTMQMANDWDVGQAAAFYTQRYAKPAGAAGSNTPPRITKFTIDPSANVNLWTAALSLDIGDRVTVKRRTSPGVTITGDYYIEQVTPNINSAASTWTVDYQLSPVFNPAVWILGDATKGVLGSTTVCVY